VLDILIILIDILNNCSSSRILTTWSLGSNANFSSDVFDSVIFQDQINHSNKLVKRVFFTLRFFSVYFCHLMMNTGQLSLALRLYKLEGA